MAARREARPRRPVRVYPLPEAIPATKGAAKQPARWTVEEAGPFDTPRTSTVTAKMVVPLGADAVARNVRAHEVAHARWSPATVPQDVDQDCIQAVEDARMHTLLGVAGVDLRAGVHEPAAVAEGVARVAAALPDASAYRALVLSGVAVAATGSMDVWRDAVEATGYGMADGAAKDLLADAAEQARRAVEALTAERRKPKFEDTRRVAQALAELLRDVKRAQDTQRGDAAQRAETGESVAEREAREARERAAAQRVLREGMADEAEWADKAEARQREAEARTGQTADAKWGPMTVHRPPLTVPLPRNLMTKKGRPSVEGDTPKRFERLCVDGAVFVARKRERRGTVLVDMSGSMSMVPADVLAMLAAAPAARIACYSGDGRRGVLRVLADHGKRCADAHVKRPGGSYNTVDGPALRWLAKQPGPRIWVSDAHVYGVGNASGPALIADALRVKRAAGIVRVPSVSVAAVVLREHGRGGL